MNDEEITKHLTEVRKMHSVVLVKDWANKFQLLINNYIHKLKPREREFIESLLEADFFYLREKQINRLEKIYSKYKLGN